ncbi:hypothetical protein Bca52824_036320 [Brassica carinata]|uniref:Uncharacterized protein n=1 Tax=Brassica carinata TaxID=52824 RepID=A0A8X7S528_BRACI|nr:hypothetical protein Bca52824_036320 [Brassica carinata]
MINDNGTIQLQPAFFILTLSDLTSSLKPKVRCTLLKLRLLGGMQKPLTGTFTEGDDGIPRTCYVIEPVHGYSQTQKIHADRELNGIKGEANQREQKLLRLEKQVSELTKKKSGAKLMVFSLVLGLVLLIVLGILGKDSKDWGVRALFL